MATKKAEALSKHVDNDTLAAVKIVMMDNKDKSSDEVKGAVLNCGVPFSKVGAVMKEVKEAWPDDFPPPVKGGKLGKLNTAIIDAFKTNKNLTEEEFYKAILPAVKGPKNAQFYTKSYYKMAFALANGFTADELIAKL
jgi:hypothetical protein